MTNMNQIWVMPLQGSTSTMINVIVLMVFLFNSHDGTVRVPWTILEQNLNFSSQICFFLVRNVILVSNEKCEWPIQLKFLMTKYSKVFMRNMVFTNHNKYDLNCWWQINPTCLEEDFGQVRVIPPASPVILFLKKFSNHNYDRYDYFF